MQFGAYVKVPVEQSHCKLLEFWLLLPLNIQPVSNRDQCWALDRALFLEQTSHLLGGKSAVLGVSHNGDQWFILTRIYDFLGALPVVLSQHHYLGA